MSYCQYFSLFSLVMCPLIFQNVYSILQSLYHPYLLKNILLLYFSFCVFLKIILYVLGRPPYPSNHYSPDYSLIKWQFFRTLIFSLNTFITNLFFTFSCYFNYTGLKEVSLIKSGVLPILDANRARTLRNASLISKDVEDLTFWALTFKLVSSLIRTNISESK